GQKMFGHSGGIDGFNTNLSYFPKRNITIAVLANVNSDAPDSIARQLSALMQGETVILPSERREIQVGPAELEKFTGIYELDPSSNLIVSVSNGKLLAQLGGEEPRQLLAESPTRFFLRTSDSQVE